MAYNSKYAILTLFLLLLSSYFIWPELSPLNQDINKNKTSDPLGKNISSFIWENYQNVDWVSSAELLELQNVSDNYTHGNITSICSMENTSNLTE
jgi:hypothetical protein